jgi:hypothetical protein
VLLTRGGGGLRSTDASPPPPSPPPSPPSPPPPSPPPPSPPPPPHNATDWGGYTPVPATAVLPDKYMCDGYGSVSLSSRTLAQCRASCDSTSGCAGFSWGLNVPSPSPPSFLDRRRTLLAHDEPAVANVTGSCYLTTSMPTSASNASSAFTSAGCYAKSSRLPPTWRPFALC